ncbi:hypothetical protein RDI58_025697 [Solanum bulbocastanum]|uniref:Helicase ATP-binding domain-containing protein n=1 Tax=Solanum bulbocastanum TaxID=147425 RepID=A0AAN8T0H1_SOLBU
MNYESYRVVEKSPCGRYIRYNHKLGVGAFKQVYIGWDRVQKLELAWNQIENGNLFNEEANGSLFVKEPKGTPEFMAPECYDGEYNELVGVYSFGMCLLEMVTGEYPYLECSTQVHIFNKLYAGVKPASLGKVKDSRLNEIIDKCMLPVSVRPSAEELLKDSFFKPSIAVSVMKNIKRAPPPPSSSSAATQGPKPSKYVVHIGGIPVEFPYQPYGTQLAFMNRVIVTLDRAHRDGHSHALLESPTGTGKSLSLLCSTLAWQQNYKSMNRYSKFTHSKPDPQALADPIGHGGGFIPETQPLGNPDTAPPAASNGTKKKKAAPTIFYASKLLLKDQEAGCSEFKNTHKVKGHPSIQKGGCHEAHDIEDLVKVGQIVKGCSYFGARSLADDAELVFCPYNYIINPVVRRAMEVVITGAIIILDEAHNIEDICRDAGSVDVEEDILLQLQMELEQLIQSDTMIYQPLVEMTQDIRSWIARKKNTLEKHGFQHYASCWTGDKALKELQEANVTKQCFPILQECASKAIRAASEAEPGTDHLSGMAASLALQRHVKKSPGTAVGSWTQTFSLWCLNPAVVFREIADSCLSVILTSGTLSPMDSFSSELGVTFGTSLEAPHVIDVESQLWAAVIPRGPRNYPLNASFKTADSYAFQDALGTSLEEICKIVPGGCLVFFPSYKLMDKLSSRWKETGQWARLNARKPIFTEPRGGQEEFESVLKGYYSSINQREKLVMGRNKKAKGSALSDGTPLEVSNENKKEGAAFLAVCRGKVSEGIDFSDEKARVVVSFFLSLNYVTICLLTPGI